MNGDKNTTRDGIPMTIWREMTVYKIKYRNMVSNFSSRRANGHQQY
jgi:hypothetical protein